MKINNVQTYVMFYVFVMGVCAVGQTIPANKAQLNSWFSQHVKHFSNRRATLDPELVAAEEKPIVIKVRKDGSGNFKTITDAIKTVPVGNKKRVLISIGGGVYKEKIKIERSKPFITLIGSPNNMPTLTYNGDAAKYGTVDSATLIVESDYFMASNIIIVNSSPRPDARKVGGQAVAARISGDKSVLYNCKMIGFQDTLCDDTGLHLFKDCYIEGTVDFIFGRGTSIFLNTKLNVVGNGGLAVITAQARKEAADKSVYTFVHCTITGTGGKNTYLGRSWFQQSRVIFAYTNMADIIHPLGWETNKHPNFEKTLVFGEYGNSGPGANRNGRARFSKALSSNDVKPFISLDYIEGSKWLLPPPNPKV